MKSGLVKKVERGALPPPPEAAKTDLTASVKQDFPVAPAVDAATVPTMFASKKKAVTKGVKVNLAKPKEVAAPLAPVPAAASAADLPPAVPLDEKDAEVLEVAQEDVTVAPELLALQEAVKEQEQQNVYSLKGDQAFVPESSRAFAKYITTTFSEFALPPRLGPLNFEACSTMELKTYKYQEFVREYMRSASPYRGVLVYHGLGSGKTCTAIATAEALYGSSDKKIIVMTPISLQENFINEIGFCGFQHFRVQNHWIPFSLTDPAQRLFANRVVGIPEKHIKAVLRKSPEDRVFWMPDFTKPPNYETLTTEQQTAIRLQIRSIIMSRITFIGYTGITHDTLKQIACDKPDFFDDAVIVIDEVHNLTRLMRGKLDRYLRNVREGAVQKKKPLKIPFSYEPVTTERWKPKLCGSSQKYDRAFLFYRLLAQAKRSKIIALSGTPIVNFPEEVGILCNILHGYFHACETSLQSVQNDDIAKLQNLLKMHPYVSFYSLKKGEGTTTVFFTRVEESTKKVFAGDEIQGLVEDDADTPPIDQIYKELYAAAKDQKLALSTSPVFSAIPLFPDTVEGFDQYFVDTNALRMRNDTLFKKRISGLISYYKGAKEELMPKVVRDELVKCPMTPYMLGPYAEARAKERNEKKEGGSSSWGELNQLTSEASSSSYRFRSRAACNFVFPKGIPRPFPSTRKELKEASAVEQTVLGDADADAEDDEAASQAVAEALGEPEPDEEQVDEDEVLLEQDAPKGVPTNDTSIPYRNRVLMALDAVRSIATRLFKTDPAAPEEQQLANYSGKFVAILERIKASPGSSLVYSQFKTLEGIGIFSIILESQGYAPLRLVGSDEDLGFDPVTEKSLRENPEQPRYIVYSGEQSKRVRQTLINIFNTKLSALPPRILSVLDASGLIDPVTKKGNFKGEICKVFMITGAGAEGLSLRNVRTVHIMEPYWNNVRTDQVKGRAVRICSHSDLPYDPDPAKNQRTVEIFTYISVIPEKLTKARLIDESLISLDGTKTTDEHILSLSVQKEQLGNDFLKAMKEGAVDCILNQTENDAVSCFVYDGKIGDFMYDPRIMEDKDLTDRELQAAPMKATAKPALEPAGTERPPGAATAAAPVQTAQYSLITYMKKPYLVVPKKNASGQDYQALYAASDRLFTKELGKLTRTPEGKLRPVFYEVT